MVHFYNFIVLLALICNNVSGLNVPKNTHLSMKLNLPKLPKFNTKVIPAFIGGSLLFFNPLNSDALQSGGRSGGSSFRSSSSSRMNYSPSSTSSYRPSASYGYSTRVMPIMPITPFYSPFYSPFGFMPINFNLLLIVGFAYILSQVVMNRVGNSNFAGVDDNSGSLGSGASVIKFQLALSSDWASEGNIMTKMSNLSSKYGEMNNRNDLARLLSETSLLLLRAQDDWHAVAHESEHFNFQASRAEIEFQKIAIQERTKFETENSPSGYSGLIRESGEALSKPTLAVVSIIVAVRGKSNGVMSSPVRTFTDARKCLQGLAADAMTDEGDNILGVEILWTPDKPSMTLKDKDLIQDYPELLKL